MNDTVGIDLGTTNSVIARWETGKKSTARVIKNRENGDSLFPSVYSWQGPTSAYPKGRWLVGWPALNNWRAAPRDTVVCVKRLIGRRYDEPEVEKTRHVFPYTIQQAADGGVELWLGSQARTPVEVSAAYLRNLSEVAAEELGRPVTSAVITVPAYFEEKQRAATRDAGEAAGLRVRKIIDEPTAAALAYAARCHQRGESLRDQILVFDLGGGTFDISIMKVVAGQADRAPNFEVEHIDGDNFLGGSDFDKAIMDEIYGVLGNDLGERLKGLVGDERDRLRVALLSEAERCKKELSSRTEDELRFDFRGVGLSDMPADFRHVLTRNRYEELIQDKVDLIMNKVNAALAARSYAPNQIDRVLLIGGASRTPIVRLRLAELFGEEKLAYDVVDPMTAVAEGAAFLASCLRGVECAKPGCGTTRRVVYTRADRTIERNLFEPTVNEDTQTHCTACGESLATGRTATEGITVSDKTSGSLGILVVRGTDFQAYDCLVQRNQTYPLPQPIRKDYLPSAVTKRLVVPVYEADDERGDNRRYQGHVVWDLGSAVTPNTPVSVEFNLDRNRTVLVTIRTKGPQGEDLAKEVRLATLTPPSNAAQAESSDPTAQLRLMTQHVDAMLRAHGDYLEPKGLQRGTLERLVAEANELLDRAGQNPSQLYPDEVRKHTDKLEEGLMESGWGTYLYLGDLVVQWPEAAGLTEKIRMAQQNLRRAADAGQHQDAGGYMGELKALVSTVRERRGRSSSRGPQARTYDVNTLLRIGS